MRDKTNTILRALIVDDEPPAQRRLRRLLETTGRVVVVAAAGSVAEALESTGPGDIDVAFLDVQMPQEDGFSYVDKVPFDVSIVFVTAYSTFAVRAFEVAALDYLLKPVDPVRLDAALDRIAMEVRLRSERGDTGYSRTHDGLHNEEKLLCLQLTGGARFVPVNAIICVLARDDYTLVVLKDGSSELVSVSMQRWESRLPSNRFERVHRSVIAAIPLIERISRERNRWLAYLTGLRDPIPINRDAARKLRSTISL